ncbi:MAG: hypothetical protein ACRD3E_19255 [Terriglobales bacterium]
MVEAEVLDDHDMTFEVACAEMEHTLGRQLTPDERSAMRLSQSSVEATPMKVERRERDRNIDNQLGAPAIED